MNKISKESLEVQAFKDLYDYVKRVKIANSNVSYWQLVIVDLESNLVDFLGLRFRQSSKWNEL